MLRLLKSLLRFALRHWGTSLIVLVLLGTSVALDAKPEWRQRAESIAQPVLEWAGFVQHSHESDDVYWCPMHPQIKRKNANDVCPICNMALVLLEGGGADSTPGELTLTARQSVFHYIEIFYNQRRRHQTLDWVSPSEFESTFHSRITKTVETTENNTPITVV